MENQKKITSQNLAKILTEFFAEILRWFFLNRPRRKYLMMIPWVERELASQCVRGLKSPKLGKESIDLPNIAQDHA